jgi:hypothetical protein
MISALRCIRDKSCGNDACREEGAILGFESLIRFRHWSIAITTPPFISRCRPRTTTLSTLSRPCFQLQSSHCLRPGCFSFVYRAATPTLLPFCRLALWCRRRRRVFAVSVCASVVLVNVPVLIHISLVRRQLDFAHALAVMLCRRRDQCQFKPSLAGYY